MIVVSCLCSQVADRLEKAVSNVLKKGYRTGDIMSEGCQQVKCSEMGELLLKETESGVPV